MGTINCLEGVHITPLKIIENQKGNVMRGLRSDEDLFSGFGEAYFSKIKYNSIKGWKLHTRMIMNLIVPSGEVRFVLFDNRADSITNGEFFEHILSEQKYSRLTVPPNIWFAFMGMGKNDSLILNLSNILHDDNEVQVKMIDEIDYDWNVDL